MTSAEKALTATCALGVILLVGHLIRGGSEQAASDARAVLRGEDRSPSAWQRALSPMHAGPVRSGPDSLYPDPTLTPGAVLPVTVAQVCTPGYSKGVRNVPPQEKAEVYKRYGIPDVPGTHEVDHFISLELGGSNDITNLWPEPYDPRPGAHEKDKVENYLHAQVCSGAMTLQQAQDAIRTDWYAVYQKMGQQMSASAAR